MPDLMDVIKATGAANKASNFLGYGDTIPPAVRQGLGLLTGIANPYAFLLSKGIEYAKNQAVQNSPELQALQDVKAQNDAQGQMYQGMIRNQLRDVLPESVAQSIPEYKMPTATLEQMGVDLDPTAFQQGGVDQSQGQMPSPEQMSYYSQDYAPPPEVPTLANIQPDPTAQQGQPTESFDTYADMGYGDGYDFRNGGIASLRRYR
jgi:hypothetical protein